MERNLDPNVVVIDKKVFEEMLLSIEYDREHPFKKHAKKFNPHLRGGEDEVEKKEKHRLYKEKLHEFREFMKSAVGMIVKLYFPFTKDPPQEVQLIKVTKKNQIVRLIYRYRTGDRMVQQTDSLQYLKIFPKEEKA